MRVGIYIANLSAQQGGGFTYLTELLSILQQAPPGHEFVSVGLAQSVFAETWTHISIELPSLVPEGLETDGFSMPRDIKVDEEICRQLSNGQIDVMWYPDPFSILTLQYPYFLTIWDLEHRHKPYFPEINQGGNWLWREQHFLMTLQRAARVFTATEAGKQELLHFYRLSEKNIQYLPMIMPKPPALFSEEEVKKTLARHNLDSGFLFYPAQFWPHKNHISLLRALQIVKERRGHTPTLVLTGSDKGNQAYIRQKVEELGLQSQVRFLGFISRPDLFCLYQGALALSYVSYFGPDNLPPLEAFASRCPVISSTLSGAEEQLGDAALLVRPDHPEDIANAIIQLIENPSAREALIQGGLRKMENHSPEKFRAALFQTLNEFEPFRSSWAFDFNQEESSPSGDQTADLTTGVLGIRHDLQEKQKLITYLLSECEKRGEFLSRQNQVIAENDQLIGDLQAELHHLKKPKPKKSFFRFLRFFLTFGSTWILWGQTC